MFLLYAYMIKNEGYLTKHVRVAMVRISLLENCMKIALKSQFNTVPNIGKDNF